MKSIDLRRSPRCSLSVWARVLWLASGAVLVSGCASTYHLVKQKKAARTFEEARELGAEQYAPYEYYSAKVRITEAKHQAAHAEYGAAGQLSDEATEFGTKAIAIAKKARRAGVRPLPEDGAPNGAATDGAPDGAATDGAPNGAAPKGPPDDPSTLETGSSDATPAGSNEGDHTPPGEQK